MENAPFPLGLPSLWAGAGGKYSWKGFNISQISNFSKGVCNCDTYVSHLTDRDREIYWAAGLDGSKILMKWNSILGQGNDSFPISI